MTIHSKATIPNYNNNHRGGYYAVDTRKKRKRGVIPS